MRALKFIAYFFFLSVAWMAFAPSTRAQWVCHVVENGYADTQQGSPFYGTYVFTALSCKGNNAIAAAIVNSLQGLPGYSIAFLISHDGGATWNIENQGLPAASWEHVPIIRKIVPVDSLHIFAFGDTDLLVRSTNGGGMWQQLSTPTKDSIADLSFSDSLHGIMVVADSQGTYITTDGGINWLPGLFSSTLGWQCHDYGNGKYRIFKSYTGVVYTTTNNWNTVDSTNPIIPDSAEQLLYPFAWCSFADDTLLAYGGHLPSNGGLFPAIAKSTNGGTNWTLVSNDTTFRDGASTGVVYSLSDISRDTIIGGLNYKVNTCIWSTDRGNSWKLDTLILKDSKVGVGKTFGIGFNAEGDLLAAVSVLDGIAPALIMGIQSSDGIPSPIIAPSEFEIYPNPATNKISVAGINGPFNILDPLGRTYSVLKNGNTLDVSALPSGVYFISDGHTGAKFIKE